MSRHCNISLLGLSIISALSTGAYAAETTDVKKAFIDDSKLNLHSFLYVRDRDERKKDGNFDDQITNQTLHFALDYKSGYYNDWLGFDVWAGANIKVGNTVGQSEILEYDYDCNNDGVTGDHCEKSFISVPVAAVKVKFGDEKLGFKTSAGYTRISLGTINASWGLNPHSYRGFESRLNIGKLMLGYAWADQYKNDWSSEFKDMTNAWHQGGKNGDVPVDAKVIDYINTVGAAYTFGNGGLIDVGYGEGKDYRKNWQILTRYNFSIADTATLSTQFYYQGGKYIAGDVSKVAEGNVKDESYLGIGGKLKYGNTTWSMGYSITDAPTTGNGGQYNFRLTPWANSDNRNFMTAKSQLEDFNIDGAQAISLGVNYNFVGFGMPELHIAFGGAYGWDLISDKNAASEIRTYNGSAYGVQAEIGYKFLSGTFEGLNIRVQPAIFRSADTNYKADRNDVKMLFSYSTNLLQ